MKNIHKINNNIYITSDEALPYNSSIFDSGAFYHRDPVGDVHIITKHTFKPNPHFCKRIILTTDQDLIKDGLQAIDDKFLEWFVKNPSCESIKINDLYSYTNENTEHVGYKIIIPKEEPKQYTSEELEGFEDFKSLIRQKQEELKFKNRQIGAAGFVANQIMENMISKPKQETLEEVAENYSISKSSSPVFKEAHKKDFIVGAEWGAKEQAKRMYSEEEVRKIAEEVRWQAIGNPLEFTKNFEKWFENNKKK